MRSLSDIGIDSSIPVAAQARRIHWALFFVRLAGTMLGIIAASMGIVYWMTRFLAI